MGSIIFITSNHFFQMDDIAALAHSANQDVTPRVIKLEKENQDLRNSTYFTYYHNCYKIL